MTPEQEQAIAIASARLRLKQKQQPAATAGNFRPLADRVTPETREQMAAQQAAIDQAEYRNLPEWQKPLVAGYDVMNFMGKAPFFGYAEKAIAGAKAPFSDKTYEQLLEEARRSTEASRNRAGAGTAAAGELAANLAALPTRAVQGANALTRIGLNALEGLGYGTVAAGGSDQDLARGAGVGAALGGGGGAGAELTGAAMGLLSRVVKNFLAHPSEQAMETLYRAGKAAGLTSESIQAFVKRHGPEGMGLDILGKQGEAVGRTAANISPEARETLETAVQGRKAGQNERVIAEMEALSGVKPGSVKTVEDIQNQVYARQRPAIDVAYKEARTAGYDLPREPFRDVLETPMGSEAYKNAAVSLKNRRGFEGDDAASELARLDQTKQELDSIAKVARRAGDNNRAAQAEALAKKLREQMDKSIAGPEYEEARRLARKGFQSQEAVQTGADLAARNTRLDQPGKARAVEMAEDRLAMRQAYTQAQKERLRNAQSTEGAIAPMTTPAGQEAIAAVFGKRGGRITDRLETEKMFNRSARGITGGPTTARQLADIAGGAIGTGVVSHLLGFDPFESGGAATLAGAGGALTRGRISEAVQNYVTGRNRASAPYMAEALVAGPQNIPLSSRIQPTPPLSPADSNALARVMIQLGLPMAGYRDGY
jgi:hypothetical protein